MESYTIEKKHSKVVVNNLGLKIVEKCIFWRALGKPMRDAMDTDNSVNNIKYIHFSTARL